MTKSIPFPLSVPEVPLARGGMDDAAFHVMMERGLREAKADGSRSAPDFFAELRMELR